MLSRVTQNRLILVGIWPSRQKNCQHAQTAACLRLRHPWCPGSKSTTIATVTSGRNATYRNLLTQKKDRERGHGPVFKVAKCVSRSPGTSPYYFFEGSLQCELQGQLRIAPTYASSVVTLQVYFPRSESPKKKKKRLPQTSGWYATGIHLPCATYTRDKRGHCTISKVATQG